jgi:hypothetical protein
MKRLAPLAVLTLFLGLTAPAPAAGKVTLDGLLRQMTDLSLLAEFPDPPYVSRQFSSYDRASEAPGKESWFANYDRGFTLYDGVVKEKTPYYRGGPMQMKPPDGTFAAGTRVGIAPTHKPIGNYVWAYATAPDGTAIDGKIPQGYIEKSAITMDPQGHVLADMDGPGCVVRIWSANPNEAGKVRIYLDDAKEPVLSAPLEALLGGKWKTKIDGKEVTPFPDPIACERSRGYNLYFPIAYRKHCKITVEKSDIYYHVDYRTYPRGTEVETFSVARLAAAARELAAVAERMKKDGRVPTDPNARFSGNTIGPAESPLANNQARGGKGPQAEIGASAKEGEGRPKDPKQSVNTYDFERIAPGKSSTVWVIGRMQAITMLDVKVSDFKDQAKALRSLVLRGTFDDVSQPQIWCPLGDFFATSPGANSFASLPVRVAQSDNGKVVRLQAYWWMPYRQSAVLQLVNLGAESVRVTADIGTVPYGWTDRTMHFHAKWRTATMKTRPFRDWTYCNLQGKGVFVGDMLSVFNPSPAWWGEGDEKVYVDGEKFPSWFGTGSEDYYAYAWGNPKPYQHAYHNQTRCDGPGSRGHTSLNRFHILDAIPFTRSFRFDMEVWHWTPNIDVTYAATSYWYARHGTRAPDDDFKPVFQEEVRAFPQLPPPYRIAGALEGETLKVLGKSGDFEVGPQDMAPFADGQWSGDSHLWVRPPKQGEWVDLEVPVAADGKYRVVVYLTKARDYGIVQFSLDGRPLGKPIDCFNSPTVVSTGPIDLGEVELKKGKATLRGEVVGTNAKSDGLRYMWGLDCVVLKPVRE